MKRLVVLLIVGTLLMAGSYEAAYWKKTYPGVAVAGISLGNKSREQALQALQALRVKQSITLIWGTSRWEIRANEVGWEYDLEQTTETAYRVGRGGNWILDTKNKIQAWRGEVMVEPVFSLEENRLVEAIASVSAQINIPTREPEVMITEGMIVVTAGENGQEVDERKLMQAIRRAIGRAYDLSVEVPVRQLQPKLTEEQVGQLKSRAEKILNKKLTVSFESQAWDIGPEQIISWLDPTTHSTGSGQAGSGWKKIEIGDWVSQLAQTVDRTAQNAHFKFLGPNRVEEFAPAKEGIKIRQQQMVSLLVGYLEELEKSDKKSKIMEIPVEKEEPKVKTADVNNLGIKELIGKGESLFAGSIPNRIFNIKKAAENMNGILVAPGETFSFNKYVGDISAAGGYKSAYIIKEGRTVLGDGGGVCQASTTLFRAILAAGLPVEERTAHAYRVHYYEEDSQPGFDATIFTPSVDLKFKNDTPTYILIQTTVDEAKLKLVFELYGTSDGRKVSISKARVWDVTPPPPALYQDDPTLPKGVVRQVDFSAWGAKAAFDWKVIRGEEVLQQRTFYSNYRPWQAIYLRGTR